MSFKNSRSNSNYVCVSCRLSNRTGAICAECGNPTQSIGHRWRVPKKRDDKGWKFIIDKLVARGEIVFKNKDTK